MTLRASSGMEDDTPLTSVDDLQAMTVVNLKAELKARGLKQVGCKADLVRRMVEALGLASLVEDAPVETVDLADPQFRTDTSAWHDERTADSETPLTKPPNKPIAERDTDDAPEAVPSKEEDEPPPWAWMLEDGMKEEEKGRPLKMPEGFPLVHQPQERQLDDDGFDSAYEFDLSKKVIEDVLDRNIREFATEAQNSSGGVYVAANKQALRPWDGPHGKRKQKHAVVILSDVYGWEDPRMRSAVDKVADVCNVVALLPDMFRGRPWDPQRSDDEYEDWRASHDPETISSDIRACVNFARTEFSPSSLGLVGFCFGGGKALEEAAKGLVKPDAVAVFYPTRYNLSAIVPKLCCPLAAFFAEKDVLDGASEEDAIALKEALDENEKVPDFMVRIFKGQHHGFAHRPQKEDREDAEDAMLLATSWLEAYLEKRLRPSGGRVKHTNKSLWK
ncbi:unnamed protein product [Choristocarpus tenellus]